MDKIKELMNVTMNSAMKYTAVLALAIAVMSSGRYCVFWYHQPKMPDKVRMMKRP